MTLQLLLAAWAAQTPARVVLLPIQPVDDVPPRVSQKLDELLAAEIPSLPTDAPKLSATAVESEAQAAWDQGLASYRALEFAAAIKMISKATGILEGALERLSDVDLLVNALIDLAVAQLGAKQNDAAEASLARVVELRPELALSIEKYPPRVIQTFDKVKKKFGAKKRVRLSMSSSPGFAKLEVDGIARGDTPLNIELLPGRHRWVVSKEGHLPASGAVALGIKEQSLEVALVEDPIPRAKGIIAAAVKGAATTEEGLQAANELGSAFGAEEVMVPVLAQQGSDYLLALARIAGGKRTALVWATVDRDLVRAHEAIRELAAGRSGPPSPRIDPSRSLAGIIAVSAEQPLTVAKPIEEEESSNAIWWWVGIGGAVVVAAAAGTTAYFLTRPDEPGQQDNIFVVTPDPGSN